MQENVIWHLFAHRQVKLHVSLGVQCILHGYTILVSIWPAPVEIQVFKVFCNVLFNVSFDTACPWVFLQGLLYFNYIALCSFYCSWNQESSRSCLCRRSRMSTVTKTIELMISFSYSNSSVIICLTFLYQSISTSGMSNLLDGGRLSLAALIMR